MYENTIDEGVKPKAKYAQKTLRGTCTRKIYLCKKSGVKDRGECKCLAICSLLLQETNCVAFCWCDEETLVSITARTFLVTIYLDTIYNEMRMTAPYQSTGA